MLPLATPTFTGTPTDAVKKIDVHGDVGTELQSPLASKVSAFDTDLGGIISKSLNVVKGIGKTLSDNGMDLVTARDRIRDALGGSRAAISDISEMLERTIMGDMTGVDEGTGYVRRANTMIDSVKLVTDSYTRVFKQDGYKNVSGVLGFIRDLTGNQLINTFDLGAEAALVKGIITEVSRWGVPELIDETFGAKWNSDKDIWEYEYSDEFRFSVTKRASDGISPSTSLDVIIALITHGGDKALIADNPSFPTQLLAGYVLPEGCMQGGPFPVDPLKPLDKQTKPNYVHQGHQLLYVLNKLKPDWFYVNRKVATGNPTAPFRDEVNWNLEYLNTASEAAQAVLQTNPDIRDAMLAAPFYRQESGITLIKNMYPYFVS